jgi:hypothetical protein
MGRRRRAVLLAVLAVCGVALAVAVNVVTGGDLPEPLQRYRGYGWPMVAVLTLAAAAGAVWQGLGERSRQRRPAARVPAGDRRRATAAVRQYVRARLDQSLGRIVRVQLGLAARPDAVEPPRDWYVDGPRSIAPLTPDTRIRDVFCDFDESMLILGEPGAGKTTLLLELADQVLDEPDGPLPVLIELAGWASPLEDSPRAARRDAPTDLHDWLLREVQATYGIGVEVARRWLRANQLILLLDGLDEVPAYARDSCAKLINELQLRYPRLRLAVGCRRQEYEMLRNRLALRGALVINPLDDSRIDAFLADPALATARVAVREDPSLRELLTAPIWLYVLAVAAETEDWRHPQDYDKAADRRRQLLDAYIDALLARPRARRGARNRDQTLRWLSMIAQVLQARGQTTVSLRGGIRGATVSALPQYDEGSVFAWTVTSRAVLLCGLPLLWQSLRTFGVLGGIAGMLAAAAPAFLIGVMVTLLHLRPPRWLHRRDHLRAWGLTLGTLALATVGLAAARPLADVLARIPTPLRLFVMLLVLALPLARFAWLLLGDSSTVSLIALATLLAGAVAVWIGRHDTATTLALITGLLGTALWSAPLSMVLGSLRRGNAGGYFAAIPFAVRAAIVAGAALVAALFTGLPRGDVGITVPAVLVAAGFAGAGAGMYLGHQIPTRWFDRWLLLYFGLLPVRLGRFLADAADQGLLQREPDGYRFPHPLLAARIADR